MIFNKVLVANRGEIALRIMKTLKQMQIASVALYTDMEVDDLHVKTADEALSLGDGNLSETWLNIPLIISIALQHNVDAIHPGYGFLSENAGFARACEEAGIHFIGPHSDVIEKMGSKIMASEYARNAGIPLLPRLEGSPSELIENAGQLELPLLVKAAAGGGGKGMIRIDSYQMLGQSVMSAAAQAQRYFADDKVYLEKYVQNPRHIEVQVLADKYGNVVHLHERECTLQRNHQKVVEEAPSVSLNDENRTALHQAAVNLARTVGYTSAGTVEFILDAEGKFFFLEMNTRIQVEHPVTEAITGIDIVKEQLYIAMGKTLSFVQDDVKAAGHAVEVRLYAEDPANNFRPSAGEIQKLIIPEGNRMRVDSAIKGAGKVHPSFDAMIAKIISFAASRPQAVEQMRNALEGVLVHGITTNLNLLSGIMRDELYLNNQITTHSIADNLQRWANVPEEQDSVHVAAGLFVWLKRYTNSNGGGAWRMAAAEGVNVNGQEIQLFSHPLGDNGLQVFAQNNHEVFENIFVERNKISFLWNKNQHSVVFSYSEHSAMFLINGVHYKVVLPEVIPAAKKHAGANVHKMMDLKASLFGRVLRVNVSENQKVKSGDPLLVLETMKMENTILAPGDNIISKINVKEGDQVHDGQTLFLFE